MFKCSSIKVYNIKKNILQFILHGDDADTPLGENQKNDFQILKIK